MASGQAATGPPDTLATVLEVVARHFGTPSSGLDADAPLTSLAGMESLLMLRAVADLEDEIGVRIPDDLLFEVSTAREFAAVLDDLARDR